MVKALRGTLALLVAALLVPSPLLACCDDFWSCAGAVASAGLSCAVEAALNVAKDLIVKAEGDRDSRKAELEADLAASKVQTDAELQNMKQEADGAATAATNYLQEATKLVGDDASRLKTSLGRPASQVMKPTPTPAKAAPGTSIETRASQEALQKLLSDPTVTDLLHRLEAEKESAMKAQEAQQLKAGAAQAGILASDARIRALFAQTFVAAIASIVVTLYAAIENPFDIFSAIAAAVFDLNQAIVVVGQNLSSSVDQENTIKQALLSEPSLLADQAATHAQKAKTILDAIEKAVRIQDASERHRIASDALLVLGHPPTSAATARAKIPSFVNLVAFSKKLGPDLVSLKSVLQGVDKNRPVNTAPFRSKLVVYFDSYFKGKSPADGRKTRDELLLEARKRFASDPKTLAAVEKLVNDEARARGVV